MKVIKNMAQTIKKDNRGGKREGAGRKRETLSQSQVREMLAKAKEYAKKYGKTIDDILLEVIYSDNQKDALAAVKLWKEYTIAKLQEGGEIDTQIGPEVYLPDQDKGPELKVVGSDVPRGTNGD